MVTTTIEPSHRDKIQAKILGQAELAWCLKSHMQCASRDESREYACWYDDGSVCGRSQICIECWSKDISPGEFKKFTQGWHEYMPKATDAKLEIKLLKELDKGRKVFLHSIKTPMLFSNRSVIHVYDWIDGGLS